MEFCCFDINFTTPFKDQRKKFIPDSRDQKQEEEEEELTDGFCCLQIDS